MADFNQQIIQEFRANAGKVGGMFEGTDLVLLTTVGAKSGKRRTSPVGTPGTATASSSSPPTPANPITPTGTTTCGPIRR